MKKSDKPKSALIELARLLRDCMDREQPYQYLLNLQNSMRAIGFKNKDTTAAVKEHESRRRISVRRKNIQAPSAYEVYGKDSLLQWLGEIESRRPMSPVDERNEWMLSEYGGKTPIQEIWEVAERKWPKYPLKNHYSVVPILIRYCEKVGKPFPHRGKPKI